MFEYLKTLKVKKPLVHCITNVVTVNACANALLAVGARPVMAAHKAEISEITAQSDALLINTGTITDAGIEAMMEALKHASVPVTLDCVGAAASSFRLNVINELIKIRIPDIIKGNTSEINAVCGGNMSRSGVDAAGGLNADAAAKFAENNSCVVMATGETDYIFSKNGVIGIQNGCADMARVTGTGCMLGALTAALSAVETSAKSAAYAAAVMGVCGELAETEKGTGTFYVNLIDELSKINDETVEKRVRYL